MGAFYHIFIDPKSGVTTEQIETQMSLSKDWYRYTAKTYVVYSSASLEKLTARYKDLVEDGGTCFICKFEKLNTNGWMYPDFWEWLGKDRSSQTR